LYGLCCTFLQVLAQHARNNRKSAQFGASMQCVNEQRVLVP
jgi:hypothetical protein